jgi:hypothetical protein
MIIQEKVIPFPVGTGSFVEFTRISGEKIILNTNYIMRILPFKEEGKDCYEVVYLALSNWKTLSVYTYDISMLINSEVK